MVRKISITGEAGTLTIDRPLLDSLHIDENTPLQISTDGRRLIIEPVADPSRTERFERAVAEADRKYGRMFKRLAE